MLLVLPTLQQIWLSSFPFCNLLDCESIQTEQCDPRTRNDSLVIKFVPDFKKAYRVEISGEVRHPGTFAVIPGERLSSLIQRAGGYTENAYMPAAEFYRDSVQKWQQERLDESLERLEVAAKLNSQQFAMEASILTEEKYEVAAEQERIDRVLKTIRGKKAKGRMVVHLQDPDKMEGTTDNFELMDCDRLTIPRQPDEVHVVGAVFNQTALLYSEGVTARQYLRECGGPTDSADMSSAFIIRADGSADSMQSARKNYQWDPDRYQYSTGNLLSSRLYPGDTLVISYDVKPHLSRLGITKTILQIFFQAALATGIIIAL